MNKLDENKAFETRVKDITFKDSIEREQARAWFYEGYNKGVQESLLFLLTQMFDACDSELKAMSPEGLKKVKERLDYFLKYTPSDKDIEKMVKLSLRWVDEQTVMKHFGSQEYEGESGRIRYIQDNWEK